MKRIFYLFAFVLFGMVSCTFDESSTQVDDGVVRTVLTVNIGDADDTKTQIGTIGDNVEIVWCEGDEIAVFSGPDMATKTKFTLESGAGTANGVFVSSQEVTGEIIAVYPYSDDITSFTSYNQVVGKYWRYIKWNLPAVQIYRDQSFGNGALPMMARGNVGEALKFNYLLSGIAVKVDSYYSRSISKVTVTANEAICGECEYSVDGTTGFTIRSGLNDATKEITLKLAAPVSITTGSTFFVALKKGSYEFVVNFYDQDGRIFHKIYKGKTLTTGKIHANKNFISFVENGKAYTTGELGSPFWESFCKDGDIWAGVNCGYDPVSYPYGKLYQWGRKDGFAYTKEHDVSNTGAFLSLGYINKIGGAAPTYGGEDPNTFYQGFGENASFYNDWLKVGSHYLWNGKGAVQSDDSPVKGMYDPCPPGWRIPTKQEITRLIGYHLDQPLTSKFSVGTHGSSTMKGYSMGSVFLPAADFYHSDGSTPEFAHNYIRLWTSTTYDAGHKYNDSSKQEEPWDVGSYAMCVVDDKHTPVSIWAIQRSAALPVRCIMIK